MNKQFEYRGYWWLPSNPDRQVAGILMYIPNEKIELELIGDFYEDSLLSRSNTKESVIDGKKVIMCTPKDSSEAVIHGVIYDEKNHVKDVTLFHCFQGSINNNWDCSFPIVRYRPWYVIIDRHLSDFNECTFNRFRVYTPVMNSWLFPGAIQQSMQFDKDDHVKTTKRSWEIEPINNVIPRCEVPIDSDYKLLFYGSVSSSSEDNGLKVSLSQATAFEFAKIQGESTLSDLLNKMYLFLDFLNLASLNSTPIEQIVLYDDHHGETYGDKFRIRPMSLYFIPRQRTESKKLRDIHCLFTFEQVSGVFDNLIQKWYSDADIIAPIRKHLVNSIVRKPGFDSGDFLIVVQALEGYHRRFVELDMSDSLRQQYFEKPKKPYLRERLKHLTDEFKFIDSISITEEDIKSIVDSRDYYSHFFKREEKPLLLDGKELFLIYVQLRVLLICCILRLIGLQNDSIKGLVKKCQNHILNTKYS
jgi:hypothetical protein